MIHRRVLLILLLGVMGANSLVDINSRAKIKEGEFTPFYSASEKITKVKVSSFLIDKTPVTNENFNRFISAHQEWNRESVSSLLSDRNYLKHWPEDGQLTSEMKNAPVINVSWFASLAYCESKGGRLPTVHEWEYVAAASGSEKNASRDPEFVQQLLTWYASPSRSVVDTPVGKSPPNVWGVYNMHGLVWEWVEDFNSVFVSGDNRRDGEDLKNMFCGAGSFSAEDKANYAAFMRYALRSSLKGNYTTENLGFRCAYNLSNMGNAIRK